MNIMTVLGNVLAPMSLLWINIGLAAGIIIGALPGLTGTMGIALLLRYLRRFHYCNSDQYTRHPCFCGNKPGRVSDGTAGTCQTRSA